MKEKTKKKMKLILMVLLILIVQFMGITYAKYITQEKDGGIGKVAKWSFKLEKPGIGTQNIKVISSTANNSLIDGKVAPGTKGEIPLVLDATGSEVDLMYEVKFSNEKNKPTNIRYKYNGIEYNSLSQLPQISGEIKHDAETKKITIRIPWEWYFETGSGKPQIAENDIVDTTDAKNIENFTFDVTVTAVQSK